MHFATTTWTGLLCILMQVPVHASPQTLADRPWLDPTLPNEQRLQLFLAQLNSTQKYAMVQGDTELDDNGTGVNPCIGHISGNDTLGVPSICMGDGPAGVGNSLNNVTAFPAPVVAAASWNTTLEYAYGQALAQEHMAKGRNVVLSPTINILRSPLWARAAETFSEDPWLTSRMAVAGVMGVQSQGALACPKHFAAYNQDTNRFGLSPDWDTVDVHVNKRVLHELYLPAFKASIQEADAASIMCSYNMLNGAFTCENDWLLNTTLRQEWGFQGFVVADWYFSTRSTVGAVMAGLDISMPGGSLEDLYGFPAYYGELLVEAVENGTIPASRIDDMVARLWRYMFKLGMVDNPVTGDADSVARSQAHLDLAQKMAEDGSVLLKNDDQTLPLSSQKYSQVAVFGIDGTNQSQVTENHGGFVIDSTMVVQSPLVALKRRAGKEGNMTVTYSEAYPGTGQFPTAPASLFVNEGLNVTYYTTTDFSGPVNQTEFVPNITAATYPSELWVSWPQVFSCVYEGIFKPNTSGMHHFSLTGQGDAVLYIDGNVVANMSKANFGNTVQGVANLKAGDEVSLSLNYSMGYSLSTGAYGVTLGLDVGNEARDEGAVSLAKKSDLSIIFVSDRHSEGVDSNLGLSLPGDQDTMISRIAKYSKKTVVVLNTNSAILMPWVDEVDAVLESWYGGQQIGLALERLLFGDISPSGKLPLTFPKTLNGTIPITSDLNVSYGEGLYVGYRWYDEHEIDPLFSFGHGLTYSTFALSNIAIQLANSTATSVSPSVICSTELANTGAVPASEVVQLYVSYPKAANEPPKLLKAFAKVHLEAGDNTKVLLQVLIDDLRIWSEQKEDWELVHGEYRFLVGFSASDIKSEGTMVL
jgi:beta-glucosidase